MKKVVSILAGALMLGTVASSASALNLYDADGQNLGTFLGQDSTAYLNFAGGWKSISFDVDGRVYGWVVYHQTQDCSGPAYIDATAGAQSVFRIGERLLVGKKTSTYLTAKMCSQEDADGCYQSNLCGRDPAEQVEPEILSHWIPVVDVTEKLPFNYPVSYPLTYK